MLMSGSLTVVEPISDGSDEEDNSVDDDVTFDDEDSDEGETDSGKEDKKVKLKSESDSEYLWSPLKPLAKYCRCNPHIRPIPL